MMVVLERREALRRRGSAIGARRVYAVGKKPAGIFTLTVRFWEKDASFSLADDRPAGKSVFREDLSRSRRMFKTNLKAPGAICSGTAFRSQYPRLASGLPRATDLFLCPGRK
jgi:hypothetical protein